MKKGFTLIELLAVVAIMSIILVAAIPMFQGMGKKDMGSAAAQLRATLRLARQYAVTQRQNVYVVFPDNRADASTNDVDKLLRSYAVLMTNSTSGGFQYITDWKYLPQGIYFDDANASGGAGSIWKTAHALPFSFPFPGENSSTRLMPVINFRPNGRCYGLEAGGWTVNDFSIYFTSSRFYSKNPAGTRLIQGTDIPGVTNNVRVRGRTGQVEIRQDFQSL